MKLYSSAICVGLLVVMYCKPSGEEPAKVLDRTCRENAYAVAKIESIPAETLKTLPRAQLQANASIVAKYRKNCPVK